MILIGLFISFSILAVIFDSIITPIVSGYKVTDLRDADMSLPKVLIILKIFAVTEPIIVYMLPAMLFTMLISAKPIEWLQVDKSLKWQAVVLIVLIMLAILPMQGFLNEWNHTWNLSEVSRRMDERNRDMLKALTKASGFTSLLVNILLITTASTLTKAFFFQGVLQKLVIQLMPGFPWIGVIITSVIFGVSSFDGYLFISQFLLCLQLGIIVYLTGNLWFAVLGHFIAGVVTMVLLYLYQIGVLLQDPIQYSGIAWYSAVISFIITTALIWYLRKKWPKPVVIIEDVEVIGSN
ncbi:hypothetical protein GCM10022209_40650 [Chitinophaga oryziterrae]